MVHYEYVQVFNNIRKTLKKACGRLLLPIVHNLITILILTYFPDVLEGASEEHGRGDDSTAANSSSTEVSPINSSHDSPSDHMDQ